MILTGKPLEAEQSKSKSWQNQLRDEALMRWLLAALHPVLSQSDLLGLPFVPTHSGRLQLWRKRDG